MITTIERPLRETDPAGTRVHWHWCDDIEDVERTSQGTLIRVYRDGEYLIAAVRVDDNPTVETPLFLDALMTYASDDRQLELAV
jgi:hypothetical protein